MRNHFRVKFHLKSCYRTTKKQAFNFSTSVSPQFLLQNPCLQIPNLRPKRREFANLLQLSISRNPIIHYKIIHGQIIVSGLQSDTFLANILINVCSKSDRVDNARVVFDKMPHKNLITWSSMVSMYSQQGYSEEALMVFVDLQRKSGEHPNEFVLASVIRACTQLGVVEKGAQLHGFVVRSGFDQDVYVGTSLIDFYSKNGNIEEARLVFDQLSEKTAVTWTTIIAGYTKCGRSAVSLELFAQMRETNVVPDRYVVSSVLSACSMLEFLEGGKQIHAYVLRRGTEMDVSVVNVLIDFYTKCNRVKAGRKLFDQMVVKNIISWTTMISGYMQNSFDWEAMKLFGEMNRLGWKPDGFACTSVLTSCGSREALEQGRQVHAYTIKANLESDEFVKNGLIDMYAKSNLLIDAKKVFDVMAEQNVISYNAMIEGYSSQEKLSEALELFHEMRVRLQKPNEFTFAALITAASNLASLRHGQQFHNQLVKMGLDFCPFVTNALVDMYAKCGSIEEARKMFNSSIWRDVVCWNSMISTHAQHGEAEEALGMFREMMKEGIQPNYVTFVAVLSACSHAGRVEDGLNHFNSMPGFGIKPGTEHYACVVSLLGRSGKLFEAKEFIEKMPIEPAAIVWRSLLSACRIAGNVELGKYAAEMAISTDPKDSGSYILLSNIFASKGMWADVKKVRDRMDSSEVVKEPGRSWIEVNNKVNVFIARDTTHREADIGSVLDILIQHIKGAGYVPDATALLMNDGG
ncbi:unnamed protein product, partial [Vitis vinifera]